MENELIHCGFLIGDQEKNRIVAVSTSSVFDDDQLLNTYWKTDSDSIDSGFQGHIYTRSNDILVIRIPDFSELAVQLSLSAIDEAKYIWEFLTGIELISSKGQITISGNFISTPKATKSNIHYFNGSLNEAAKNEFNTGDNSLIAFVLNSKLIRSFQSSNQLTSELIKIAQTNTILMDKNKTMAILQENGVRCAKTYLIDESHPLENLLEKLSPKKKWIFKPSGGAAGIGVFGRIEKGANKNQIKNHIAELMELNLFPVRSQVQEFIEGEAFGVTAFIFPDGRFEIFEIHRQQINASGRFTGGNWNPEIQQEKMEMVSDLYQQLAGVNNPSIRGLICIDFIGDKIIEINPRLTASAPIAHLLRLEQKIRSFRGSDFAIKKIDLNTTVSVSHDQILDGRIKELAIDLQKKFGVLILPQGINPFGNSRFIFINDDPNATAQKEFLQRLKY